MLLLFYIFLLFFLPRLNKNIVHATYYSQNRNKAPFSSDKSDKLQDKAFFWYDFDYPINTKYLQQKTHYSNDAQFTPLYFRQPRFSILKIWDDTNLNCPKTYIQHLTYVLKYFTIF